MLVLGIETSCDETAVGIVEDRFTVRSNVVASQVELHAPFGGVVPEVAARAHLDLMLPTIDQALVQAGVRLSDVDAIAVTSGPGLIGALLVGVSAAKGLALAHDVPLVGVNHLRAHVEAAQLEHGELEPPLLALVVSGGHTSLVVMEEAADGGLSSEPGSPLARGGTRRPESKWAADGGLSSEPGSPLAQGGTRRPESKWAADGGLSSTGGLSSEPGSPLARGGTRRPESKWAADGGLSSIRSFRQLGATIDDAAGEAFDKIARFLGLGYPGGPEIDRLARDGDPSAFAFPRALRDGSYDFSLSGLKTAVIRELRRLEAAGDQPDLADVAASFQEAIVDVQVEKSLAAAAAEGIERLVIAGGVAANSRLRERMRAASVDAGLELLVPHVSLCTDNGAMVAASGANLLAAGADGPGAAGGLSPSTAAGGSDEAPAGLGLVVDPNLPLAG